LHSLLQYNMQVAVKLLTVDTEEPAVLDAFLKEVALCACLRSCSRIVRLLGACLGGVGSSSRSSTGKPAAAAAAAAGSAAAAGRLSAVGENEADGDAAATGQVVDADGNSSSSQAEAAAAAASAQQQHGEQQQQQQQLALIMELVEGGNLAQRIYHPSKRRLSYLEVRCYKFGWKLLLA
jgi:serine/threonine protein kinase